MTIKQYVLDALGKFWTKLKSTYVTNCASTSNNLALAASQGKVLQDQITALNSRYLLTAEYYNVSAAKDCNTLTKELSLCQAASGLHFPSDSGFYYVFSYAYTKNSDGTISTGVQYAVQYATSQHIAWQRKCSNNTWDSWVKQPTRDEIDALNSKTITSITAASGITFIGQVLTKRGHVVMCRLWLTGDQLANNDYTVVGTVPSGFEPVSEVTPPVVLSATEGTLGYARLVQNGTLSIYKKGTSTAAMYVYFVYVTN